MVIEGWATAQWLFGGCISAGLTLGAVIALVNSWRP